MSSRNPQLAQLASEPSASSPHRAAHVLLVDDNPLQLQSQRLHLERAGFRVTTAADAAEALQAVRRVAADLVLSDVMMPGIDGFQLCRTLRRDPATRTLPVVLVSGHYGEALDVQHAARCGANLFVARSDGIATLLSGIRRTLRRPRARLELPDDEILDTEHSGCVFDQLGRLSRANTRAALRISAQERFLSHMVGAAEQFASQFNRDRLAQYFVAAGLAQVLVYRLDPGGRLELAEHAGCDAVAEQARDLFGERQLFERLVERNEQMLLPHPGAPTGLQDALERQGYRAAALLPLACATERFGLVVVLSDKRERRDRTVAAFGRAMASQLGTLLWSRSNEERMGLAAQTDALTGLANRARFVEGLEQGVADAVPRGDATGVLLISLGNFREINDTLGPKGGDCVLRETAARLKEAAAGTDFVCARLGGAQFGVLIPRLDDAQHLASGQALRASLAAPITVDGVAVEAAPSVGAARCPDDALAGLELLRRASVAMHHARERRLPYASYCAEQDPCGRRTGVPS